MTTTNGRKSRKGARWCFQCEWPDKMDPKAPPVVGDPTELKARTKKAARREIAAIASKVENHAQFKDATIRVVVVVDEFSVKVETVSKVSLK